MIETQKAAQAEFDERYLRALERVAELHAQAAVRDRHDPVHAELRRALEQVADIERQLRMHGQADPVTLAKPVHVA